MDPILVATLLAGAALVTGLLGALIGGAVVRRRLTPSASGVEALPSPTVPANTAPIAIDPHEELLRDALETLAERIARLERLGQDMSDRLAQPSPARVEQIARAIPDAASLTARAIAIPSAHTPSDAPPVPSIAGSAIVEPLPTAQRVATMSVARAELHRVVIASAARGQDAVAIAQLLDLSVGEVELILRLHRTP